MSEEDEEEEITDAQRGEPEEQVKVWLAMYNEHCTHARHHETQRGVMTGFVIASTAAISNLVFADKSLDLRDLPFSLSLFMFGVSGALLCAKHFERFQYHMRRAKEVRRELDKQILGGRARELILKAQRVIKRKYSWRYNLELDKGWIGLHLVVASIGAILSVIALFYPFLWE